MLAHKNFATANLENLCVNILAWEQHAKLVMQQLRPGDVVRLVGVPQSANGQVRPGLSRPPTKHGCFVLSIPLSCLAMSSTVFLCCPFD